MLGVVVGEDSLLWRVSSLTYWPTKYIVRKKTSRATCWYLFFLKRTNLVDSSAVYFQKRNTIRLKGKKKGAFWPRFSLVRFDPHINETGLYKPRFFQVRHCKSSSAGEALSVWVAFFSVRSLLLFVNCSFQNKLFSVLFVNCSSQNKFFSECYNCSSWNKIVRFWFNCSFQNNFVRLRFSKDILSRFSAFVAVLLSR